MTQRDRPSHGGEDSGRGILGIGKLDGAFLLYFPHFWFLGFWVSGFLGFWFKVVPAACIPPISWFKLSLLAVFPLHPCYDVAFCQYYSHFLGIIVPAGCISPIS